MLANDYLFYVIEFSEVRCDVAPSLTIWHEEVSGFCEGAVSCQRGGPDPHAVVPRLHQ